MTTLSALNNLGANNLGAITPSKEVNQFAQTLQATGLDGNSTLQKAAEQAESLDEVKAVFQEFVAGTFYGSMLKAMHAMHDKPAFMHGGQAEEMFQNQLDQQIAGQLASEHGEDLVKPLLPAFAREVNHSELAREVKLPTVPPRK